MTRWRRAAACLLLGLTAALTALTSGDSVRADDQVIQIGAARRSAAVRLIGGKSETVRTDRSFVEVIVSDPEIADIVPLTDRSLSILGKKVGTTRVSMYGDAKSPVGVSTSRSATTPRCWRPSCANASPMPASASPR
jgi:pilus assembly protein CpaC